ncbi:GPI inositol-deacylase [Leucoagaricus sp. SymC.cos]|nr:GPI inositol-deacylase [Leucoagaricus sp. SymC.cos]
MPPSTVLLACFTVFALLLFIFANNDLAATLSPQGCRMSYMSPSYVLQESFNASWSRLSSRYSLWLYREVGWDPQVNRYFTQVPNGYPVLFIPGNAGSSHQVRSIASSASRQFYSSPGQASTEFISNGVCALDFYAVEFNEDLSAFHGTTLQSQVEYTSAAVDYILSRYPPNTPLVVLGHSMGGIVGTALLPSGRVSAIITMSTPHSLPPARFDSRIDDIYAIIRHNLDNDTTPILSLCGGATDMMIPSESCMLPSPKEDIYRKTVFTSALEGAWTGVGHREMVWCHQVRWRVARALLELTSQHSLAGKELVLNTWFRDANGLPHGVSERLKGSPSFELAIPDSYEIIPPGLQLIRKPMGSHMYLLPMPLSQDKEYTTRLSVLVGKGSIVNISPHRQHSLHISVYGCALAKGHDYPRCSPLSPAILKLVPRPIPGQLFPLPRLESDGNSGGVDESDGVVLYEAEIKMRHCQWVGLKAVNGDGKGWVVAGFSRKQEVTHVISTPSLLIQNALVDITAEGSLRIDVWFPRLSSNALVVYRLTPLFDEPSHCMESHLAPLLVHTSNSVETHYYPLDPEGRQRILLHTHLPAPYHGQGNKKGEGIRLVIYSSGTSSCINQLKGIALSIDLSATLGRWASRYMTTVIGWAAGISSIPLFLGLGAYDRGGKFASKGISS